MTTYDFASQYDFINDQYYQHEPEHAELTDTMSDNYYIRRCRIGKIYMKKVKNEVTCF